MDGGEPQLRAVKEILEAAKIPVLGRDKSGDHSKNAEVKIVVPAADGYNIVPLKEGSHIAKLIARIDEESHRFAITYHRLLQKKNMLK